MTDIHNTFSTDFEWKPFTDEERNNFIETRGLEPSAFYELMAALDLSDLDRPAEYWENWERERIDVALQLHPNERLKRQVEFFLEHSVWALNWQEFLENAADRKEWDMDELLWQVKGVIVVSQLLCLMRATLDNGEPHKAWYLLEHLRQGHELQRSEVEPVSEWMCLPRWVRYEDPSWGDVCRDGRWLIPIHDAEDTPLPHPLQFLPGDPVAILGHMSQADEPN